MMQTSTDIQRLIAARDKLAALVVADPAFLPYFDRVESEIALENSHQSKVDRASRIVRRRADLAELV